MKNMNKKFKKLGKKHSKLFLPLMRLNDYKIVETESGKDLKIDDEFYLIFGSFIYKTLQKEIESKFL